jgi:HEAT repeat protein
MQLRAKALTLLAALALSAAAQAAAHGGIFLVPVDPNNPPVPSPSAAQPGPSQLPGAAKTPKAGPATPDPLRGSEDLERMYWSAWWHYNRANYLEVKAHIHDSGTLTGSDDFYLGHGERSLARDSLKPSSATVQEHVVPALLVALRTARSNDLRSACLIALAKIGESPNVAVEDSLAQVFLPWLKHPNQEVAETAAVALGILGNEDMVQPLTALFFNNAEGRALVGTSEVPYRTRAFAGYGLGVIGSQTHDEALKRLIASRLIEILEGPDFSGPDIKVAALSALGLTAIELSPEPPRPSVAWGSSPAREHVLSRRTQLEYLLGWLDPRITRAKKRERKIQWHVPIALARLLPDVGASPRSSVVGALLEQLGAGARTLPELQEGVVLALGEIGDCDDDAQDQAIRSALLDASKGGDAMTRRFALLSLARVSGRPGEGEEPLAGMPQTIKHLLHTMARGKSQLRPWAGLSAGVLGRSLAEQGVSPPGSLALALIDATRSSSRPLNTGAYAVGLGLLGDARSEAPLLQKLHSVREDISRGYVAVGLGLAGHRSSIEAIQGMLEKAKYKPVLLWQSAIGLGLLGDKTVVPDLVSMLMTARGMASQSSTASALGIIGDARSVQPLVDMLAAKKAVGSSARAFAAVALGIVCDPKPLAWNTSYSLGANYRFAPRTMTGNGQGILDIL